MSRILELYLRWHERWDYPNCKECEKPVRFAILEPCKFLHVYYPGSFLPTVSLSPLVLELSYSDSMEDGNMPLFTWRTLMLFGVRFSGRPLMLIFSLAYVFVSLKEERHCLVRGPYMPSWITSHKIWKFSILMGNGQRGTWLRIKLLQI